MPKPEYIETPNTVKLILKNNIDERTAYRTKELNGGINGGINNNLKDEELLLLNELNKTPNATQNILALQTGFSKRKVERIMKSLREKKIIRRIGSNKNGKWVIMVDFIVK